MMPGMTSSKHVMEAIRVWVAQRKAGWNLPESEAELYSLARYHRRLLSLERWYKGRNYVNSKTAHKS